MKRFKNYYVNLRNPISIEHNKRCFFPLAIGSILSVFLLFLTTLTNFPSGSLLPSLPSYNSISYVESKFRPVPVSLLPPPPRFAYLVSEAAGDGAMLRRILLAMYHPRNQYILHLDMAALPEERIDVEKFNRDHPVFRKFGNVRMIKKANLVTYRGPTMVANTLNGAAILLNEGGDWDWFINLSASDYPLVTQDDLLHTFSYLPRELNFIDHTSKIGWKEGQRAKPVIVDPGLYNTQKNDVFWVTQRRSVPTAFKLFTGSYL